MRLLISVLLLMFIFTAHADSELRVKFRSGELGSSADLGFVDVEGLGAVELTASRNGSQLTVYARYTDGRVIGKAETVVGLRDTPIYVKTSRGLEKITIFWGAE